MYTLKRSPPRSQDVYLAKNGKWRKLIARDGSCLFRAVADHVFHHQGRHVEIRERVVDHLRNNPEEYKVFVETEKVPWDLYLFDMADPKTWGSQVEISIISKLYGLNFTIYREQPEPGIDHVYGSPIVESEHSKKSIRPDHIEVCYASNTHYDLVVSNTYRDLATCMQGIIYDLLFTTLHVPKPPGLEKGETYINAEFETWRLANRTRWKRDQKVEAKYPGDGKFQTARPRAHNRCACLLVVGCAPLLRLSLLASPTKKSFVLTYC